MKKLILILLLSVTAMIAGATNYFVKASGSSANTGLSDAQAWSLSKVSSFSFGPDDHISLKCGDTFTGTINFTRSGTSGHPIIFDSYGYGVNPIIDGGGSSLTCINITGNFVTIQNITPQHVANSGITLNTGCHDITIQNCFVNGCVRGINAYHCGTAGVANLFVNACYFFNITDNPSHSSGGGSAIQFNSCIGAGQRIWNNYIQVNCVLNNANTANAGVGDDISIYQCYGISGSPIDIYNNHIRGGGSTTFGYSGINPGDRGGAYQHVHHNYLDNTGVAGIQVPGGHNIVVDTNYIYSGRFPYTVLGIHYYITDTVTTSNVTIQNNVINWTSAYASPAYSISNKKFDSPVTMPTGWTTNSADTFADPGASDSMLPNPLFNTSAALGPWNNKLTAPPITTYPGSPFTYVYGSTISNINPSNSGGAVVSYSITGTLPSGLSFNTTTGVISGTNTGVKSTTSYQIIATNSTGADTTSISITVNKAVLTIVPNLAFKFQGQANPAFTSSYVGFQLSDNVSSLSAPATVSTTATMSSPAGTHPLTASGTVATNYSFNYIPGLFIIIPATIGVVIHTPVIVLTH